MSLPLMQEFKIDRERYDHADKHKPAYEAPPGVTEDVVRYISKSKEEPEWMLEKRLKGLKLYQETGFPEWGPDLSNLIKDMDKIKFFVQPNAKETTKWEDLPDEIRETYERIGIPEAEKRSLSGVGAQYDSEVVYHNLKKEWEDQGVVFTNMDTAVKKYPDLVKKYFMTSCVPINDHKFVMLHAAVWSGGTFIYIPKNVKVKIPLQAYFRMNVELGGQFEHTLIIADEGSEISYVEGCSAPQYGTSALHAGCVEIHVMKNARVRYSSVENWSKNTYNLNTKRAIVQENGLIEFINGNLGSGVTMLYPCSVLVGRGARSDSLGIAFADKNQNQDTGSKVIHAAPDTSSTITAKSISKDGGISTYRGLVKVMPRAINSKVSVECDALLVGENSTSNTYPTMKVLNNKVDVAHEATVGKIGTEEIFYLMSRGLSEERAKQLIVSGFIEPIVKELPLEYAVELNKLIELEMEGSIG
ncbi:Fe-S cluster assembly protein SufB [Candidatus Woesearchaeota archaeon]|nr:Fe-S cluster assembly protein SufB [Candidatus Woesearchaeota archaeon]